MNAPQINNAAPAPRTLADFGLVDPAKVSCASYYVDAVTGPKITFREVGTVYVDDLENQRRVVLYLTLETRKRAGKKVPVPNTIPRLKVSNLSGYDPVKNIWGQGGHEESYVELSLEEAAAFNQQFEALRAGMVKEKNHWTWYRSDLALAS
ncbi:hypothetical protein [Pseudomonas baetica]|uniref:hypothetical protein n=1 Tax=Pseudomonas baetica TaxID=674054 RepID=UPI00240735AD|nr:hypothetical protein [Pseudomonas baetica]MDF9779021.1 hypothetical protein [Pseudomonas baetica]